MDEWRILRNNAWLIHCSLVKEPGSMLDTIPLPYDWEIPLMEKREQDELQDNVYLYEEAKRLGYFSSKIA